MENKELTPWFGGLGKRTGKGIFSLHEAVDRLFEDWFQDFGLEPSRSPLVKTNGFNIPSVDVSETDKEVKIAAELPGMDEKDIEVTLSKDNLIIKGEKKEEKEEKRKDYYRKERSFGSVYREIPLPCEVLADKVNAEFRKGVLNVVLPKSPQAQKETIKVPIKGA